MYLLVLAVVFWIIVAHAYVSGANAKFVMIVSLLWLSGYALKQFLPGLAAAVSVTQALLVVVLALWLKITDHL